MTPRVFISHSSKKDIPRLFLKNIEKALRGDGFDVFVDESEIEPGDEFKKEIDENIARCHGAVLLLSKEALSSEWVHYEASVLAHRRTTGKNFVLLPVLLPPVNETDLRTGAFAPLALGDLVAIKSADYADIDTIVRRFKPLREAFQDAPIDRLVDAIVFELPRSQPLLETAARTVGIELETADPETSARDVAAALLRSGLQGLRETLLTLAGRMSKSGVARVVDIAHPFWISAITVLPLAHAARSPGPRKLPMINASLDAIARMYVRRAAEQYPLLWKLIPVTAAGGENTVDAIIGEIRHFFRELTHAEPNADDAWIDARIAGAAKIEPVVVILPPTVRLQSVIEVRKRYPHCTFILLTGGSVPERDRLTGLDAVMLEPMLDPGAEAATFDLYLACCSISESMH